MNENVHIVPPRGNARLLRHRAKMQRKFDFQFSKEGYAERRRIYGDSAFWYEPSGGVPGSIGETLRAPKFKDPLYLWMFDQSMAQAVMKMPRQPYHDTGIDYWGIASAKGYDGPLTSTHGQNGIMKLTSRLGKIGELPSTTIIINTRGEDGKTINRTETVLGQDLRDDGLYVAVPNEVPNGGIVRCVLETRY